MQDNISRIQLLHETGRYHEAIELIEKHEMETPQHLPWLTVWKARIYDLLGKMKEAQDVLEDLLPDDTQPPEYFGNQDLLYLAILDSKMHIYHSLGNYDEAYRLLEISEPISKRSSITESKSPCNYQMGIHHYIKGLILTDKLIYGDALLSFDEALEQFTICKNDYSKSLAYDGKAVVYRAKKIYKLSEKYFKEALSIRNKLQNPYLLARSYNYLGSLFYDRGDNKSTLEFLFKSLEIREKIGNKQSIAKVLNNIGLIHRNLGDLTSALKYYQKAVDLKKEVGNQRDLTNTLNNIGNIYRLKGSLDIALDYYTQSLEIAEKQDYKISMASIYGQIGKNYYLAQNFEEAKHYLQKAIEIQESLEDHVEISDIQFQLALIMLEEKDFDQARDYHRQIAETCFTQPDFKRLHLQHKILEALLLKASKKTINLAKAMEMLQEVFESDVDYEFTRHAAIELCDLLLDEYILYQEDEVLQEIISLLDQLIKMGQENYSYLLIINTYLLKSRLTAIQGNFSSAVKLLENAEKMAMAWDLVILQSRVNSQKQTLLDTIDSWQQISTESSEIKDKVELEKIRKYLQDIKKSSA